jgi:hypothetical protein
MPSGADGRGPESHPSGASTAHNGNVTAVECDNARSRMLSTSGENKCALPHIHGRGARLDGAVDVRLVLSPQMPRPPIPGRPLGGPARALEAAMLCHDLVRPAPGGPCGRDRSTNTGHDLVRRRRPGTIWSADAGHGEGMWPTILSPLHRPVAGLSEGSIRSLLSDTSIRAHASGRGALTGVAVPSVPRVAAFGPGS